MPFPIDAEIAGYGHALDPDQIWIEYRLSHAGVWIRTDMTYAGEGHWQATIPGQTQPAEIAYYIHAGNIEGDWVTSPPSGADDPYRFDVGWLVEPFGGGYGGFIINPDGDDTADQGIWEWAEPTGSCAQPHEDHTRSGSHCWLTENNEGISQRDVDNGKTTLQTPPYDLTGAIAATAKYWRWYAAQNPGTDAWLAQVRNNGGEWLDIENGAASSGEWEEIHADLTEIFGLGIGELEFRFVAQDEGTDSYIEAAIDDFSILVEFRDPSDVASQGCEAPRFALRGSHPNPFRSGTEILYQIPRTAQVQLTIHDLSGRLIRTLLDGEFIAAGENVQVWDGTDDGGLRVGCGFYYVRIKTESHRGTRSLVLVR